MTTPNTLPENNDEISLRDLIKSVHSLFLLFFRNILYVAAVGLIGGGIGYYLANSSTPIYTAKSNFIVKEGGAAGLAGSLGSLSSLIGVSGPNQLDRTLAIMGSEKIMGKVLLTPIEIKNDTDLVINHYIKLNKNLQKAWSKDTILSKARFDSSDINTTDFNFPQRKAYKTVLAGFIGEKGIVSKSFDKKSSVISMAVTHLNEDFAIEVNRLIYKELTLFIREQASETAGTNVDILKRKVDSIQGALDGTRRSLAKQTDQSLGLILSEDKVSLKSLAAKEQILLGMFAEAQKNYETFLFMEQSASNAGTLTLLDAPFAPIKPIKKSKVLYAAGGFILGAFICFGFIVTRRWYRKLMAS